MKTVFKISSGMDLKVIMQIIIKLSIMKNIMLNTGIFPENLKSAKVVQLYKKGDEGFLCYL